MKIAAIGLLACASVFAARAAGLTATDVVSRADTLFRGATSRSTLTMKIVRPGWTRELGMKLWSKGDDYAMILVTAPARDKGTVFLKRKNEMWQWVPAVQRVIKIPPSMMSQSWMGSDFTNDDLVKEASVTRDYSHRFLADTAIGDVWLYRIEMVPKPDAPVVWDKIILWIAKGSFTEYRAEYYDETGGMAAVMNLGRHKMLGGRLLPSLLEMVPVDKKGQKTILEYKSIEFNRPMPESFFSLQNMKQVR